MTERHEQALALAAEAHAGQHDSDGRLHIEHVRRVVAGAPDLAKTVAALHDVVEDCGVTLAQLAGQIRLDGSETRALELLTRRAHEPYFTYVERIARHAGMPGYLARAVKRADVRDNLERSTAAGDETRVAKYTQALELLGS